MRGPTIPQQARALEDALADAATFRALEEAAARLEALCATAHERVPCPKCGAPVLERCRRVSEVHGYRPNAPPLKRSHVERLRADGIELR